MFYVYILNSLKNDRYYVGSCEDVRKRLLEHNRCMVKSTKAYIPWRVVHTESFLTLSDARKREAQIKSWKKRSSIERLVKHF